MRHVCALLLLSVAAFLVAQIPGRADIAPLRKRPSQPPGGTAALKSPHQSIRMEAEEVRIQLRRETYTVDAVFRMFNTGKAATEWVGFPKKEEGDSSSYDDEPQFVRFNMWLQGKMMQFDDQYDVSAVRPPTEGSSDISPDKRSRMQWLEDSNWLMRQVSFPGRAKTVINVSYEARYGEGSLGSEYAHYIYGTGRHWRGSIGKARFTLDCSEKGGVDRVEVLFSPADERKYVIRRKLISQNVVQYEIMNFEPHPRGRLSVRFDPGLTEDDDESVLVLAAKQGREEIVKSILDKGVSVDARGKYVSTPLIAAAKADRVSVVELLLERGADVNGRGKYGTTALMAASQRDSGQLVKRLLDKGADVNSKDNDGRTALMHAAAEGRLQVAQVLLAEGANIGARDKNRRTALNIAQQRRHALIEELLRAWGAKE